ncbi:hypothetical protein B0G75_12013 [Paraburkholderia sp. BL18I3N2]|nr:hypothetical protein B0G75_12013 [Paraburkholderia sp. BL18I3N2]PRX90730.1 hypothetical protein B0G73_14227 [Paraburkholderia sp. BL25I1N1]
MLIASGKEIFFKLGHLNSHGQPRSNLGSSYSFWHKSHNCDRSLLWYPSSLLLNIQFECGRNLSNFPTYTGAEPDNDGRRIKNGRIIGLSNMRL